MVGRILQPYAIIAARAIRMDQPGIKVPVHQAVFLVQDDQLHPLGEEIVAHRSHHAVHGKGNHRNHRSAGNAGGIYRRNNRLGGVHPLLGHLGSRQHLQHNALAQQAAPVIRVIVRKGIQGIETILKGIQPIGEHVLIVQVQQHGFRYRIGDGYHGVDGAVDLDLRHPLLGTAQGDRLEVAFHPIIIE